MESLNKIVIFGVGFMGGSLALALKKKYPKISICGYARNQNSYRRLKSLKLLDVVSRDISFLVQDSDIVVLALPVERNIDYMKKIANYLKKGSIVFDLGSSKKLVEKESLKTLPPRSYFVGCHPLCGSEKSGAEFSDPGLYKGQICIITSQAKSEAVKKIRKLWEDLGSKVIFMDPVSHDKILSKVSHLPHVVSFALTDYVPLDYIKFSSGSFRQLTRISASPARVWTEIFSSNKKNLLADIKGFTRILEKFSRIIKKGSKEELADFISKLNLKHKKKI